VAYQARYDRLLKDEGGWIGVDFDGTLVEYHGHVNDWSYGKPVDLMVERVREWLARGITVKIVTARADIPGQRAAVGAFCIKTFGRVLEVTNRKDARMVELWDDRAVQVIPNTGKRADGKP